MLNLPSKLSGQRLSRKGLLVLMTGLLLVVVYCWHLGSLTPGLSADEAAARTQTRGAHIINQNLSYAPHEAVQYLVQKTGHHGATSMRLVSVLAALVFIVCFYKITKSLFGRSVGWFASILFAFTPLIILTGRNASPFVMLLYPTLIGALYIWLTQTTKFSALRFFALLVATAVGLYIPGIVWLVIVGLLLARQSLRRIVTSLPLKKILVIFLLPVAILVPLIWNLVQHPPVIKTIFLLPQQWPGTIVAIKSICWMGLSLFVRAGTTNSLIIGRLPLLDVAQIVLILFGAYALWGRARNKTYQLLAVTIAGIIFAGINQNIAYLLISLPALGLLAAAGLRYLYIEWRGVFPRNPIPRGLALLLMLALVGVQIFYGTRYSLVAWPHTVATRQVYVIK